MGKYIIGGGITGLIAIEMLKHKGYTLIAGRGNIGGQLSGSQMGPRILKIDRYSATLIGRLGINESEMRYFRVGYLTDGGLSRSVPEFANEMYNAKARGGVSVSESMSAGSNEIFGVDMLKANLVQKLIKNNSKHIIFADVESININQHSLGYILRNGQMVFDEYEDLISTINLQELAALCGCGFFLDNMLRDVHFYKYLERGNDVFTANLDLDYIYDLSSDSAVYRMTKVGKQGRILESSQPIKVLWNGKADRWCTKTQIVNELKMTGFCGIRLLGRYAQLDHSVKTNNIVERCLNI